MAYNNIITRAENVIPDEVAQEIIKGVPQASATLSLMRRLPNMQRNIYKMPVMSVLPMAYFISPKDTGHKQTTEANWEGVDITAEEIACIVPIPEAVLDDVNYDIWGEIKPFIVEAFGQVIDGAVLFGTNKPATWADGIVTQAVAAGNSVAIGTGTDIADDIGGESGVMALVEADGHDINGWVGDLTMKAKLRSLRNAQGDFIFQPPTSGQLPSLYGSTINFPKNGAMSASYPLIGGDFRQAVHSIRKDITYKLLTEAVITDSSNVIQYNLAQQDMVALRCVMRLGWALPNPANRVQTTKSSRCAFGVLTA